MDRRLVLRRPALVDISFADRHVLTIPSVGLK
jgi:hypothetical protein